MDNHAINHDGGASLREVQMRILDILVEIDKVCRKHHIQYWIDFGTLLGAVRHGGFIPWDDDIDITLPTGDYQKFLEIAPKELPEPLFLQTKETDHSYRLLLNKVRDKNSFFVTQHEDFTLDYNKGLYIDLFEAVPYPEINPKLQKKILLSYRKVCHFFTVKQDVTLKNHLAALTFPVLKWGLDLLWAICCLKPKNKIGYEKHFNTYGNSYDKDMIFPLKDITFEGKVFLGPADPDRYLTSIYGDYMQLPPVEKRQTHIIHASLGESHGSL